MRVYPIALCSLAALLAWEHQNRAIATPVPETITTSENSTVSQELPATKIFPSIAPPEVVTGGENKFSQALPNTIDPSNTTEFPSSDPQKKITSEEIQEELGEIEIIKRPVKQPPPRRQPDVQLLLRSSAFTSSNIAASELLQRSDVLFVNSATLLATPKLGEDTRLIAAAGGGLVKYGDNGDFNYNYLSFNVGIQQRLTNQMYGQLGWYQERLYRDGSGDRLLLDDSLRLSVGRQDQLNSRLRLDSFYELRASFATPSNQNRVANTLGARLRYDITPKLQGALDYRLSFKDYTQQDRFDTQNQLGLEAIYNINPDLFVAGSASYLFGSSSAASVDLSNFSVGVSIGLNVPLF